MAAISKSGTPSPATLNPSPECVIAGLLAGEAIAAADACFIHTDGKVYKSDASAADAESRVVGFAAMAAAANQAVTLYRNVEFEYATGLTPGAPVYLSTTEGALDTALAAALVTASQSAVGSIGEFAGAHIAIPIGFCRTATRIHLNGTAY